MLSIESIRLKMSLQIEERVYDTGSGIILGLITGKQPQNFEVRGVLHFERCRLPE